MPFIQTDGPVNPRNSNGPLFNINFAMYSASGAFVRLSFAVPIDVAVKVKDWLLRDGRVSLGVSTQDLTQRFADPSASAHGSAKRSAIGSKPLRSAEWC